MGDRCYLSLTLHGHVKDKATLAEVVTALVAEGFDNDSWSAPDEQIEAMFRKTCIESAAMGQNPEFIMAECNYGQIEDMEVILQEHAIAYHISHGSGGEYDAGCSTWTPTGYGEASGGDQGGCMLDLECVRKAMNSDAPLTNIQSLIDEVDFALGKKLPTFSVGGDLVEEVAIHTAKLALGIKEKAA